MHPRRISNKFESEITVTWSITLLSFADTEQRALAEPKTEHSIVLWQATETELN